MSIYTPAQIEEIRRNNPIEEYAGRLVHLKGRGKELYGPCPLCNDGEDRFHVNVQTQHASCRLCHNMQEWLDVIGLYQAVNGCSFLEACAALGGHPNMPATVLEPRKAAERPQIWRSDAWQADARARISDAIQRLDSDAGKVGRDYLLKRGIQPETWRAWSLGYGRDEYGQWGITLPWMVGNLCTMLNYRRVATHAKVKCLAKGDSERILYGVQMLDMSVRGLVIVEGELNAVSIWQAARDLGLSVVSIGSQTPSDRTKEAIRKLAAKFARVIVWCDEAGNAQAVMQAVGPHAEGRQSPRGLEANDLLQQGLLRAFMEGVIHGTRPPLTQTVETVRGLVRNALFVTPADYLIPPDLITFHEETPATELEQIAQRLRAIIDMHITRRAAA
ncbi:MAG: hypothetical protein CYG59_24845 [Chloroflexi bacterium]|nr:MAG: hypothetical protein CYG59_24845 [Chloroflexota bacterium]